MQFKATTAFLNKLDEYSRHVRNSSVQSTDIKIGMLTMEAGWIEAQFRRFARRPTSEQVAGVFDAIVERLRHDHQKEIAGPERNRVRSELRRMLARPTLKALYKDFYTWLGEPQMLKPLQGGKYEYPDVFPLIYLQMRIEDMPASSQIKHVVIDEMQDYTPIQYEVIANVYPCKKTILGEHNQSVSPVSSSSAEAIREILADSECMHMHKSYRSTLQLTVLTQDIQRNPNLIPIERHGEQPVIISCDNAEQELRYIREAVRAFQDSDYNTLGIICKTQDQANALYKHLGKNRAAIRLLDARGTVFSQGVIIATAFLAKGLEFDQVVVPFCSAADYNSLIDRHMLYVACTRALHKLSLTHTGDATRLLKTALERSVLQQERACA